MQAANEELADYLPQVPSAYLGGHSIPFTSLVSPTGWYLLIDSQLMYLLRAPAQRLML